MEEAEKDYNDTKEEEEEQEEQGKKGEAMRRGGRKGGRCGKTTKKKYPIPFKKPIFTTFLTLLPSRPC